MNYRVFGYPAFDWDFDNLHLGSDRPVPKKNNSKKMWKKRGKTKRK